MPVGSWRARAEQGVRSLVGVTSGGRRCVPRATGGAGSQPGATPAGADRDSGTAAANPETARRSAPARPGRLRDEAGTGVARRAGRGKGGDESRPPRGAGGPDDKRTTSKRGGMTANAFTEGISSGPVAGFEELCSLVPADRAPPRPDASRHRTTNTAGSRPGITGRNMWRSVAHRQAGDKQAPGARTRAVQAASPAGPALVSVGSE